MTNKAMLDYRFTSSPNIGNIPFELNANKPYLRVHINNSGPYWFMLDNGAIFNVVDEERAKTLGIMQSGSSEATGAGEGSIISAVGTGVSLGMEGLELASRDVTVLPINAAISFSEGRTIAGILGYSFFNLFVIEIDYARHYISLYEPRTYEYNGTGEVIPLEILRGHAFVSTQIALAGSKRVVGNFLVDTGWRSALSLNAPFVEEHTMSATETIEAVTGAGVGGPTIDAVGRVDGLQLGHHTISKPITNFSRAKTGVLSETNMAGIIGGEILRRFKVIFDYSRHRMILEPNINFTDPHEFDMSGLFVTAEGRDLRVFRVYRVIGNSPASEAGLREGDMIEAINGRSAEGITLEQIRLMFKLGVGEVYSLSLRRDEKLLEAKIKLRRLV